MQRKVGYLKMLVVKDLKSDTIKQIIEDNVALKTIIDTDNSNSYTRFKELDVDHRPYIIPKDKVNEMLPWVHIAIGNAKRLLLDIHHDIKSEYLQSYLNKFCYKYNRNTLEINYSIGCLLGELTTKTLFNTLKSILIKNISNR
jgi:transposase-like protein